MDSSSIGKEFALDQIMTTAYQVPGVKVDRKRFLAECFTSESDNLEVILAVGPVEAGCSQEKLAGLAKKLIFNRTSQSSIASFVSGIPGGVAMAATIPADLLQFLGLSLRMAQELSYLYGAPDLWKDGAVDNEQVKSQLVLYCGAMFGVSGAMAGVRFITAQMTRQVLKKLPQKALTKTLWFPVIKQIGKAIGIKVTKNTVAKGVSKVVPLVGGVISGGLNFASMMPMGQRLAAALESACFHYTESELESDYNAIVDISESEEENELHTEETEKKKFRFKGNGAMAAGFAGRFKKAEEAAAAEVKGDHEDIFAKMEKLAKLKEAGVIQEGEFEEKSGRC